MPDNRIIAIPEVVAGITARLDATRILIDYIRTLTSVVERQETLARDDAVAILGETGEALFRSVRDAYRAQATQGGLPMMESLLAVPGLIEAASPPWEMLLRQFEAQGEAPAEPVSTPSEAQSVEPPTPPVAETPSGPPPSAVVPSPAPPVPPAPPAETPRSGTGGEPPTARHVIYGVEVDPANVGTANRIVEEARRAVAAREPAAIGAYDSRVGRNKWRQELYRAVFLAEAREAGLSLDAGSALPEDAPEDDIVFGDMDDAAETQAASSPAIPDDIPAFLAEDSEGPAAAGDQSWLNPFDGGGADESGPEEPPEVEPASTVVAFAPPRPAPMRPVKVAPGLGRPSG